MTVPVPIHNNPGHICHVRQFWPEQTSGEWANEWIECPLLRCAHVHVPVAPSHSSAQLRYRFGPASLKSTLGSRTADTAIAKLPIHPPQYLQPPATTGEIATAVAGVDLSGWYVRVTIPGIGNWYGQIIETDSSERGHNANATAPLDAASGVKNYTAYGTTWWLDQDKIRTAAVHTDKREELPHGLPFNGGFDNRISGRSVTGNHYSASNRFASARRQNTDPDPANWPVDNWTALEAIEYLFAEHSPVDTSGTVQIPFSVDLSNGYTDALDWELSNTPTDGLTVWELLNQIVHRGRALGFYFEVDDTNGDVVMQLFSYSNRDLTIGSLTIPQNQNQQSWNITNAVNLNEYDVPKSETTKYDQVRVEGERAGVVFTVRPDVAPTVHTVDTADGAGQIIPDWTTGEQATYNSGIQDDGSLTPPDDTAFADLSDTRKVARNRDWRARDIFAAVYSWWTLPQNWNGYAYTYSVATANPQPDPLPDRTVAMFSIDEDSELNTTTRPTWYPDALRFAAYLPMQIGGSFRGTVTSGGIEVEPPTSFSLDDPEPGDTINYVEPSPTDSNADYLRPIILLSKDGEHWCYAERFDIVLDTEDTERPGIDWNVQSRIREDGLGLVLEVNGGQQHYLAQDVYARVDFDAIASGKGINVDHMMATVYLPLHQRVYAVYPLSTASAPDDELPTDGVNKVKLLTVEDAWFDVLCKGTIVDLEFDVDAKKNIPVETVGGILRDDRERLKVLARSAYEYFGVSRLPVNLPLRWLGSGFSLGQLITTIVNGSESTEVNTVITSIRYDLHNGKTTIETSFAELDFENA